MTPLQAAAERSPSIEPAPASHIALVHDTEPVEREIALPVAFEPARAAVELPEVVPQRRSEIADRVLNVVIAAVSLVLLAPVMLLAAIAVKLTSPGPVFYVQTRVGIDRRSRGHRSPYDRRVQDLGGRVFTIYKFRSMVADAERGSGAVWARKGDPRVTAVGRFMRSCRIDELPQLFNVLKGDMNIVGPRPERPSIFQRLCGDIDEYPLRQLARPGITGLAQINHSYDATVDDVRIKVRFDLEYLRRQGVAEDLRIMAMTIPVMIFRRGAL